MENNTNKNSSMSELRKITEIRPGQTFSFMTKNGTGTRKTCMSCLTPVKLTSLKKIGLHFYRFRISSNSNDESFIEFVPNGIIHKNDYLAYVEWHDSGTILLSILYSDDSLESYTREVFKGISEGKFTLGDITNEHVLSGTFPNQTLETSETPMEQEKNLSVSPSKRFLDLDLDDKLYAIDFSEKIVDIKSFIVSGVFREKDSDGTTVVRTVYYKNNEFAGVLVLPEADMNVECVYNKFSSLYTTSLGGVDKFLQDLKGRIEESWKSFQQTTDDGK
jgi:hypothetical protein